LLVVFMLVAAMNFGTHFIALHKGGIGAYRRDPEARWMLMLVLVSCLVVTVFINLKHVYGGFPASLRYGMFNTVSLPTGGGYCSADYGSWPAFAPLWMLLLSCMCANTGSTGGGIRMFRALLLLKELLREMFTLVHPQAVSPVKISRQVVP